MVGLGLALASPSFAEGQESAEVDPVTVSPESFRVLLDNDQVRVVEYVLQPGQRDAWHTHPPKVSYVVDGGTLRITTEDGQSFLTEEQSGSAVWMDALGLHFAENVGETPVRIVLVEVKTTSPAGSEGRP